MNDPVKFPVELVKLAKDEAKRLGARRGKGWHWPAVLRTWTRIGQETKPQLEGVRP